MSGKQETAYELDPAVAGGVDAHPFVFGGFPGLWQVGKPVHPEALGLTVTRMRELIEEFNLPLLEVKVAEGSAARAFPIPENTMLSGPDAGAPIRPEASVLETDLGIIPGPGHPAEPPPLQPITAAQMGLAPEAATIDETTTEADLVAGEADPVPTAEPETKA